MVVNVINGFQAFGEINIMTQGGPAGATNVLVYSIYRDAFFNSRFGSASAESIILFIIILSITLVQFRYEKKKVFYQ
jgi:sn-glycerol 3-phosphate transport system permease protein